jgi:hypothetical protein
MSHPSTLRAAHARLAAILRWRPDDAAAVQQAKRDLVVAQAAALVRGHRALLLGLALDSTGLDGGLAVGWPVLSLRENPPFASPRVGLGASQSA